MPVARLHGDQQAPCRFAVARFDFNQARLEIDLRPIKSLGLRASNRKRTVAQNGNVSSLAASSNCAVCATLAQYRRPFLWRAWCATGFSVHHRRVMPTRTACLTEAETCCVLRAQGSMKEPRVYIGRGDVSNGAAGSRKPRKAHRKSFKYRALARRRGGSRLTHASPPGCAARRCL
jgi:hypothetical protein